MHKSKTGIFIVFLLFGAGTACGGPIDDSGPASPSDDSKEISNFETTSKALRGLSGARLDKFVRKKMSEHGVGKIPSDFNFTQDAKLQAGILLSHDRELSGRRDTACADCHPLATATADGQTLAVGPHARKGPNGTRIPGPGHEYFPRNTPDLAMLGTGAQKTMFWDARIEATHGAFQTPFGAKLLPGLDDVVAAQAMAPVVARDEMRGEKGHKTINGKKNELAAIPDGNPRAVWEAVMDRIMAIPTYRGLLSQAFPNTPPQDLTFAHAANAIATFVRAGTAFDSPFDKYVRGDSSALSKKQKKGAALFYGPAGCADCHSGNFQTDEGFYNVAVPQLGPGLEKYAPLDPGRYRVTKNPADKFKFRTPKLRNVELTAPYMHNGAYQTLEAAVRHFRNPLNSLRNYDESQLPTVFQNEVHNSRSVRLKMLRTYDWGSGSFLLYSDKNVDRIVAFLKSLTSPTVEHVFPQFKPERVPSGLPVGGVN